MPLQVTTDHDRIRAALDRQLALDPVRATVLGTLRSALDAGAWAAVDGDLLAARSDAAHPLAVLGPWQDSTAAHAELRELLGGVPQLAGVAGVPAAVDALAADLTGGRGRRTAQRLFRCDDLVPPTGVAGRPSVATTAHRELVRTWFAAFVEELEFGFGDAHEAADRALAQDSAWVWIDDAGTPASMAVRRPVVAGSARIGPVYTPPSARGRGFGSAITAAATASVLGEGGVPVLFTDLANPTSNRIYQQLGYRPVEDRVTWSFADLPS